MRSSGRSILLASFAVLTLLVAMACTREREVVKEVPVEVVVKEEVVKEVMIPGETVVVKEEVVKEVMVPGETVVWRKRLSRK